MEYINLFINKVRLKLNSRQFRASLIKTIMWGLLSMLVIQSVSLFIPMYYSVYIGIAAVALSILAGICIGIKKRIDNRQAAIYIDSFGFKEKIITAYENQSYKDRVCQLQREDAERTLRNNQVRVIIDRNIPWLRVAIDLILIICILLASVMDTPARNKAREIHLAKKQAEEAVKEINEMLEALEKVEKGELSDAELKELEKMMKSLELSKENFKKVKSKSELESARSAYDYKLGDIEDKLNSIANGKSGNAYKSIKDAVEIAKNQKGSENLASNTSETGQNGNGQSGENQNGENGQSGENQNGENGQSGENQNGESGQGGENQNGESGQGGGNQNGEGGQSGQSGGNQNGEGGQSAQGKGQGEGQNGNGGSGGSGAGQGNQTGESERNHNHDYVSVNKNITGKYSENNSSEYSREKNGLAWDGEKVPYNTVINDYKNNAYDGIEKGKYPGSVSGIIKDYFSELGE